MAGKNYVNVATESAFATPPSSGWRGLQVEDDSHQARVTTFAPRGIVYGQAGPTAKGRRSQARGGTGTLKTPLVSNGLGQILAAFFSTATITTPPSATNARQIVYELKDTASTKSLSVQLQRELKGGTVDRSTYVGGQVTELRLTQSLPPEGGGESNEGFAKLEADLDYADINRSHAQQLPTYVDPGLTFAEAEMSIGAAYDGQGDPAAPNTFTPRCLNAFTATIGAGLRLQPDCIGGSLIRGIASRGGIPEGTLGLGWLPTDATLYTAFLEGQIMAFRCHWEPSGAAYEIDAGTNPSLTLDIPALQFTGADPQMSLDEPTSQDLPATILDNGSGVLARITQITSDTAL